MIAFPEVVQVPIVNHLTHRRYAVVPAAELTPDQETLTRIVSICNEPDVYRWLFRDRLGGQPYPIENARNWIERAKAGWHSHTHFVFAVIDEANHLAAACDIKSSDPRSEIGYWSSAAHRGIMTNVIIALCTLAADAGFTELFARTKRANVRSQAVLARAGFKRTDDRGDDYHWFARTLTAKPELCH